MKPKINRTAGVYTPQGFDCCQTPGYALDPLLPCLDRKWVVWEPACGEGYLSAALRTAGFTVMASDILAGQNFWSEQPILWDCIVTNPPYSIKYAWLNRCYDLARPFALLLPVEVIGAKRAQTLFREHGVEVVFMDRRINFKMPLKGWAGSAAQFPVCWVTFGLNIGRQMTFAELAKPGAI